MGYAHPDYLLEQLTSGQLSEWEAFYSLEPAEGKKEDYRFATLCTIITNLTRAVHGKKGCKMAKIDDFIPKWGTEAESKPTKKQSVAEMKQILFGIAAHHKGK